MRAFSTQFSVMELANDICRLAIRTCGTHLPHPAPRRRDQRRTAEICQERLGRESLYEPGERDTPISEQ